MLQRCKIHHFISPVLIFRSNQGQQYDKNPFTPICLFTYTQTYIFLYEFFPPFFPFFLVVTKKISHPNPHTALQLAFFT